MMDVMSEGRMDRTMTSLFLMSSSTFVFPSVSRHARLRSSPPHSVHWARLRHLRLGCGHRPPWASCSVSASEKTTRAPGSIVDQAGAALYGLPPALAVQGLNVGLGHHHLGVGVADAWLVLCVHRPAEESTSKRKCIGGRFFFLSLVTTTNSNNKDV